jgi:putative Mg2+ transporter-C (MgtC) family protein
MISPEETILRLAVAAVLGGFVGLERERLEWAAGMRTHALVPLGSALFMVVSIFGFSDILNEQHVILDPSRVAAQVATRHRVHRGGHDHPAQGGRQGADYRG